MALLPWGPQNANGKLDISPRLQEERAAEIFLSKGKVIVFAVRRYFNWNGMWFFFHPRSDMDGERKNDLEMQGKMLHELEIVKESENSTKFGQYLEKKIVEMKTKVEEMKKTAVQMKDIEQRAAAEEQHG